MEEDGWSAVTYRYYRTLPAKFSDGHIPSRDGIFLYPGSLSALQKAEGDHPFPTNKDANRWIATVLKASPFFRFGLLKYAIKQPRRAVGCVIELRHNALALRCMTVLERSLVWSMKHRDVAIGETQKFWREFLEDAKMCDSLDRQRFELLMRIGKIDHPLMGDIVSEAVMIRLTMSTQ